MKQFIQGFRAWGSGIRICGWSLVEALVRSGLEFRVQACGLPVPRLWGLMASDSKFELGGSGLQCEGL